MLVLSIVEQKDILFYEMLTSFVEQYNINLFGRTKQRSPTPSPLRGITGASTRATLRGNTLQSPEN
ncbi:hypothetical protein [Nostoc sp.]